MRIDIKIQRLTFLHLFVTPNSESSYDLRTGVLANGLDRDSGGKRPRRMVDIRTLSLRVGIVIRAQDERSLRLLDRQHSR
jgi:hypothetical protein